VTFNDHLQDGIYFRNGQRPSPCYRLLLLTIDQGTTPEKARDAMAAVWTMLQDLCHGVVQDIQLAPPNRPIRVPPGALTCLLGFGAQLFAHNPPLTPHGERPGELTLLLTDGERAPFPSLYWVAEADRRSGEADLALQFIANTELAVSRAVAEVWKVIQDKRLPLRIVTFHGGFNRDDHRSWLGFYDGISNIEPSARRQVIEVVDKNLPWMEGGTYMAFLRLAIDLVRWRSLPREHQEILVGRDKLTGCPLEAVIGQLVPVPLADCPFGSNHPRSPKYKDPNPPPIDQDLLTASHIHRANVNRNLPAGDARSSRIFRQGYEFLEPTPDGQLRFGLNFVSFQRSLSHLTTILTADIWLRNVNFGGPKSPRGGLTSIDLLSVIAGGFYAVPPKGTPFPGADIFRA
jgi:deferrochelatase/peroxidase EfeB